MSEREHHDRPSGTQTSLPRRRLLQGALATAGLLATNRLHLRQQLPTPPRASATSLAVPPRFAEVWAVTDATVASGAVSRTWFWGPQALAYTSEPYDEAPGGQRSVAYYDKGRMEDNTFRASPPWDVSSGLLVKDMIEGRLQVGDSRYDARTPAGIPVAGDAADPDGVTFATLTGVTARPAAVSGGAITERIDRSGTVTTDAALATQAVTYARQVPETGHTVAAVFDDFIRDTSGAWYGSDFYITGYPLTEPYWATARVGGTPRLVLLQAFERRVLTYTPDNPPGWQVEMGNVGQHYLAWRTDTTPSDLIRHSGSNWTIEIHPESSFRLTPTNPSALAPFSNTLAPGQQFTLRLMPSIEDAATRYDLDPARFTLMTLRDGQYHTHRIGHMYGRSNEIVQGPFIAAYRQQADITNFLDRDNALRNHAIANALVQLIGDASDQTLAQRVTLANLLTPHLTFTWR